MRWKMLFWKAGRMYGEHSAMYRELELIRRGMILNITLEELISDLADRSGIEEIEQFSAILNIAKRGGGNVTQIIRTTAEVISNKVETIQEMLTMLQGRRLEQNVMEIMPFGISLYIAAAYPGYFGTYRSKRQLHQLWKNTIPPPVSAILF